MLFLRPMFNSPNFRLLSIVFIALLSFVCSASLHAQTATLRGNLYNESTGEAISFCNVNLVGTTLHTISDLDGFFIFTDVPEGSYNLEAAFYGYDTLRTQVSLTAGQVKYLKLFVTESAIELQTINVSASLEQRRNEVNVSRITITPQQIKSLPSAGGEADIAQYLTVLPGIISTGDQGGQIYIRGGSPVQNKVLLDGMTIYNPFHSIGFLVFLKQKQSSLQKY